MPGPCNDCKSPLGKHKPDCPTGSQWHCYQCGWDWTSRIATKTKPISCARCKCVRWWSKSWQIHKRRSTT